MKIGQPAEKPPAVTGPAAPAAAEQAAKVDAAKAAAAGSDPSAKVELSSTAATLLSGGSGADFDAEKVGRMQQAIASGTFTVDAGAIADKLIANAQELLAKVKG